jgi:hypothetical protein
MTTKHRRNKVRIWEDQIAEIRERIMESQRLNRVKRTNAEPRVIIKRSPSRSRYYSKQGRRKMQ